MHKKINVLLLVALMLLVIAACAKTDANETTVQTTAETPTETVMESIGGVVYNPNGNDGNIDEDEVVSVMNPENSDDESDGTQVTTAPSEDMENETTPSATKPEENENTTPSKPVESLTEYEIYMAKSGEEQVAFYNTFDSVEEFMAWFNAAKAEYEAKNPAIDIGDGIIDAEDLIGNNG